VYNSIPRSVQVNLMLVFSVITLTNWFSDIVGPSFDIAAPRDVFESVFRALWNGEPVTCKSTGKTIGGLPRPRMTILEVCLRPRRRLIAANSFFSFSHMMLHSPYGPFPERTARSLSGAVFRLPRC
jgi:hypothetical protein